AIACDAGGCVHRPPVRPGLLVAYVLDRDALAEECAAADVVISRVDAGGCAAPLVIGPDELRRAGAHALFIGEGGVRVETVRRRRFARPWN
ncbi:MAG TPA: ComEC family competence protein, partial [Azospirillaceae bacterium]|nr:ComEC family competence protein [Azospirillaceae bacterium]